MRQALRARAIRENPAAGHHIKVARQRGQALPLDDLMRLVENTRADYRTAVLTLVYTGMRPSELCGLRVGRLHVLACRVHVCETLTPAGSRVVAGPTQTDQERVVPIPGSSAMRSANNSLPDQPTNYLPTTTQPANALHSEELGPVELE